VLTYDDHHLTVDIYSVLQSKKRLNYLAKYEQKNNVR
jgi:hypothetical protein